MRMHIANLNGVVYFGTLRPGLEVIVKDDVGWPDAKLRGDLEPTYFISIKEPAIPGQTLSQPGGELVFRVYKSELETIAAAINTCLELTEKTKPHPFVGASPAPGVSDLCALCHLPESNTEVHPL